MIRCLVARFTLLTLVATACGQSPEPATRGAAATDAIAKARARGADLANSNQNYQPVRFVSDIEQVRVPKPVRQPKPDTLIREGKDLVQAEPVVVPSAEPQGDAPTVAVDSTIEVSSAPRVPSIIPRDAPAPEAVGGGGSGAGTWRGTDPGPDQGTVIGVVLRGGRVDPGHCPRHGRPPSQIPNRIPR